jgi:hypothetical protein
MNLLLIFSLLLFLHPVQGTSGQPEFNYLKLKGHTVESTHRARYKIVINKSFKPLGEFQHQPSYDGIRFNVSMAAFSKLDQLILVHAEMHTDNSGGLDYSKLAPASLSGIAFTSKEQCVTAEDEPDPYSNPQLRFLRDKGYAMVFPMYLKQYFTTSRDGRAELVLTFGQRVASCKAETINDEFRKRVQDQASAAIHIKRSKPLYENH